MRTASSTQALGTRQAIRGAERSTIPAALAAIANAQLSCERIDETSYRVAKKYLFFPANGFWRNEKDGATGYSAQTLIAHTRQRKAKPTKSPAVTRDSGGIDPSRLNSGDDPDKPAEVAAGEHVTQLPPNELTRQQVLTDRL